MAISINRNNEITGEDFKSLKKRFKERTQTKALYRCVEFVVTKVPDYEKLLRKLEKENKKLGRENKKLKIKHNHLMEILIKKQSFNQKNDNKVYPAETE